MWDLLSSGENIGFICIVYMEVITCSMDNFLICNHIWTFMSLLTLIQPGLHTKTRGKVTASLSGHKEQYAARSGLPVSTLFEGVLSWAIYKIAPMYSQGRSHILLWFSLQGQFSQIKWQSLALLSCITYRCSNWTVCAERGAAAVMTEKAALPLRMDSPWWGPVSVYTI